MTTKISFKQKETTESILKQLNQNKLFEPLTAFLYQEDIVDLTCAVEKAKVTEMTIAELKETLVYRKELDRNMVSEQEVSVLENILQNNSTLQLELPYIIKLNKKNTKKMFRISKYYQQNSFLFQKFSGRNFLKNEHFFLPFLQIPVLFAMLNVLSDTQKISVVILYGLDELISIKAMLAINKKVKENPNIQPSGATLIMSEECNLRCNYCYEPQQKRDKTVLTFEKAKQVLRKFDRDSVITFFGGEPMLHIELMKQICEWGWEYRNFKFDLVTNGQIIDRAFFRDYAKYFDYVQLSCDGPEAANDINRGHGSFKRAMEFYEAFKEETGRYPTLHPVLSKYSMPYLLDIVKWFYQFESTRGETKSLRWLPGDAHIWEETDFQIYAEQLALVKDWYLENDIRVTGFSIRAFAQAEHDLLGLNNNEKMPLRGAEQFCSAGRTLMAILPSGNIVPCHHEYWCAEDERIYEEIGLNDDSPGVNHMSELCMCDIPECNSCPQWGCCICPGSFFFHSKSYTTPDKNWCRAGKMLIETAKSYAEDLAQKISDSRHKIDYLAAGVDYLLEQEKEKLKLK